MKSKGKKSRYPVPHLTIVRNPALMPVKLPVSKQEKEKAEIKKIADKKKEEKKKLPKEEQGYIKCRKHDFL